jgi:hypothetical protein
MSKRNTEQAASASIRAFDRIETKFMRAMDAYHRACNSKRKNDRTLKATFKTFQKLGGELIAAYAVMGNACGADQRAHYAERSEQLT